MVTRLTSISNKWFFKETPWYVKALLLVYINGDYIFLLPIVVGIIVCLFFSIKVGLILWGAYIFLRFLGEMIYWLLHQFSDRGYRPHDFGFKNLNNHALYILYQTFALLGMMVGIVVILLALFLF